MAEPFSIATGALGVIDLCVRLNKYLGSVRRSAKTIGSEIESLEREISNFQNVYTALGRLCEESIAQRRQKVQIQSELEDPCDALWSRAADLVREGGGLVDNLRALLTAVLGEEQSTRLGKLEDFKKAIKLLSKDAEYGQLRGRFTNVNMELNTMLTAIDL